MASETRQKENFGHFTLACPDNTENTHRNQKGYNITLALKSVLNGLNGVSERGQPLCWTVSPHVHQALEWESFGLWVIFQYTEGKAQNSLTCFLKALKSSENTTKTLSRYLMWNIRSVCSGLWAFYDRLLIVRLMSRMFGVVRGEAGFWLYLVT